MECRRTRQCARIVFRIGSFILISITFFGFGFYLSQTLYSKNYLYVSKNQARSSGVNVQFVSMTKNFSTSYTNDHQDGIDKKVKLSCNWNDLYNYDENKESFNAEFGNWQFKPPSQTRLPAISTVFQDNDKISLSNEFSVLLVSVDMCLPDERQKAGVVPAIPSQYRVFAMMRLPYLSTGMVIYRSLPYAMILAAQRAGYAGVLIFPSYTYSKVSVPQCAITHGYNPGEHYLSEKIFIPTLVGAYCFYYPNSDADQFPWKGSTSKETFYQPPSYEDINKLSFSSAKILVTITDKKMENFKTYLARLYLWLPVGPMLTVIWIIKWRRRKPEQLETQDNPFDGSSPINKDDSVIASITTNNRDLNNENTPLLPQAQTSGSQREMQETNNRQTARVGWLITIKRCVVNLLWLSGCFIFPLPLGISAGGLSFIRLDENDPENFVQLSFIGAILPHDKDMLIFFILCLSGIMLLWSPIQMMFFLIYSKVKCRKTWIVDNDISKIIRCSWFKTSILFLFFGAVTPLCVTDSQFISAMPVYITINTLTSASNIIFLLILNKHSKCTLFIFYASVCMICAYIESSVVLVIYFMLNSVGSLDSFKATALRTIEISTALGFSFQTTMHIIHKLRKPQESLFVGLSQT